MAPTGVSYGTYYDYSSNSTSDSSIYGTYTWDSTDTTSADNWGSAKAVIKYKGDYGGELRLVNDEAAIAEKFYNQGYSDGKKHGSIQKSRSYDLPDGAKLIVDDNGNYEIEDKDAQVTYKAHRNRDFSPHLNASDMVADFFKYVKGLGVPKSEMMKLPMELFISWLIIEAAERDGDDVSDITPVADSPRLITAIKPRCLYCGRYISRLHMDNNFAYCDPEHAVKKMMKLGIVLQQAT